MENNANNIDIHDRVAEAYSGKLGKKLQEETQNRMHWIRDHVTGNKILDIGCSQGIGPILLGRLGKQVTGVDVSQKAVDEANEALSDEEESVKKNVTFKKSDFLAYDAKTEKFDTITITEVLEHLFNPEDFIAKAKELLISNGNLIITVPFGINDHIDHKKTYYFLDLYQMLYKDFHIKEVSILGKWIGFIAQPREDTKQNTLDYIDIHSVEKVEKGFYLMERELVDRSNLLYAHLNKANIKYRNTTTQLGVIKEELSTTLNSASYQLGNLLIHKTRSFTDILKLPIRIIRLKKKLKNK